MTKTITIDPITRLEGHGKITIFLDNKGNVENTYFQVPELRGFERFCEGRPVEEVSQITTRICGVCPEAHHMASAKATDAVFGVEPTSAARKLRELLYSAFFVSDHATHFYILSGADFVVGPEAPVAERNILGLIAKVGKEAGMKVIDIRRECNEVISTLAGRQVHPICALPGGVSKGLDPDEQRRVSEIADHAVEFAQWTMQILTDVVLSNKEYLDLILSDAYAHQTYYMGLVDENNHVNFYDGDIRVVGPDGKEFAKFKPADYLQHLAEHVEPWTYLKFPYLKNVGWKGLVDGKDSGVYRATPLSRLNAADGMATPLAQAEYDKMYEKLGKPVHATLATHWARCVEIVYAAERMRELINDPEITSKRFRVVPTTVPDEGVGVVEAPRGTLYHHYKTNSNGIVEKVNLIVGTTNNHAAISMSIKKAAKALIKKGEVREGLLNKVEMAFRAYDPCLACATHSLPGKMPLIVDIRDKDGNLLKELRRD
jgi:F420-non-reducing hydrogenase large subunit